MILLMAFLLVLWVFVLMAFWALKNDFSLLVERLGDLEKRLATDYYTKNVVNRMINGQKKHFTNHKHDAVLAEKLKESRIEESSLSAI